MKICKVQIASGRSFQGIKSGITQLKPGDPCDPAWGGGVVADLSYSHDFNCIVVRKDRPFKHQDGKMPAFDVLAIPFALVEAVALLDENPTADELAVAEEKIKAQRADAVIKEANARPACSKCGGNSGGKPLCGTCHAAEKTAQGKGK
jgi:hypothetical protein